MMFLKHWSSPRSSLFSLFSSKDIFFLWILYLPVGCTCYWYQHYCLQKLISALYWWIHLFPVQWVLGFPFLLQCLSSAGTTLLFVVSKFVLVTSDVVLDTSSTTLVASCITWSCMFLKMSFCHCSSSCSDKYSSSQFLSW